MNTETPSSRDSFSTATRPAAPAGGEETLDLREIFRAVSRNRGLIALLTGLILSLAVWYVAAATRYYEASATVMLDTSEDAVVDFQSVAGGLTSDYQVINTEMEVMRSRNLLERVVVKLRLEEDPEFNPDLLEEEGGPLSAVLGAVGAGIGALRDALGAEEAQSPLPEGAAWPAEYSEAEMTRHLAVDMLQGAIDISNVEDSYVFEIAVLTEDPMKSAAIANAVAEQYILDQLEVKFEATSQATAWLSERVADLKAQLERAESAVQEQSARASLVSEEALAAQERRIKELRARLEDASAQAGQLSARAARAAELRAGGRLEDAADALASRRLRSLAIDAAALAPEDERRPALEARYDAMFDAETAALREQAARAVEQAALMRDGVAELEAEYETQAADLVQLQQLQREAEASGLIYEYFLGRMKETSVQQGIQQADARILSPAIAPQVASEPRGLRILVMSLVAGAMLSTLGVVIVSQMRTAIRAPEELEAFSGRMVMGVIPAAPTRDRRKLMEYMVRKPSSALAEAIRNLRTAILMSDLDRTPQVVMVSSSAMGEGKTTTALLLAQNSAMLGKRVLAMECDLRRNVFDSYFDRDGRPGLMAVLSGEAALDEAIRRDPQTGLDVIAGEESKVNAADVFSSARFGELMEELRARYDHVFIDTPPVLAVPDARVLSRHADAIIFAVRWNETTRDMVRTSLDLLRQVNARATGLVLTQVNTRRLARHGYSGYGYGYGRRRAERYYRN